MALKNQSQSDHQPLALSDQDINNRIALEAVTAAIDQKAIDVCALHLGEVSDVADFFVIASGTSQKHVQGVADKVRERLKAAGESTLSVSGHERGDWIVLDYASVVVHLFYEPVRQFYDLDGLWSEAARVGLPDNLEEHAKRLRTGMYACAPA